MNKADSHPRQQENILSHSDGRKIPIRSFCQAEEIRGYAFDEQFGTHAQYRSIYTRKETLEENALQAGANVTLAIVDNCIIGFGVLNHPEPEDRWNELGAGIMMEVKVIEVARSWRSSGIAQGILGLMTADPIVEEMIVYMVGYSWTWDLDGTRKSAQAYRNMMIRLFEPFGFQELQTNEPNICLKPENLFMGRIGERVSDEMRTRFKWLRFGVNM
jgi:acetoin utilization protein AcuA